MQRTLTIANNGNSTLTVTSISYPGGFSGNWSGTVAAGGSQTVAVTFSPDAATSYSGNLIVNSDKTGGIHTLAVSGTGTVTPTPIIALSGNLAFGSVTVGSTKQATLTIANTGNATLTVSSISYPSGFSGAWSGAIPAGSSHDVAVSFAPTLAQAYSGSVTVTSDKTSGNNTLAVSGNGVTAHTWQITWQSSDGGSGVWNMNGTSLVTAPLFSPNPIDPAWQIVGNRDFNNNGQADVVWQSNAGLIGLWYMNGAQQTSWSYFNPSRGDAGWHIRAVDDMDGDHQPDLLWEHNDGRVGVWYMNNAALRDWEYFDPSPVPPAWKIVGTGDFDGDGKTDIVWRRDDGWMGVWFMNGAVQKSTANFDPPRVYPPWTLMGSADVNGDGKPDLVWEDNSGYLGVWYMDGLKQTGFAFFDPIKVDPKWRIKSVR